MKTIMRGKWRRYVIVVWLMFCLLACNRIPVQAADTSPYVNHVGQFDSNGDAKDVSTAIPFYNGEEIEVFSKQMDSGAGDELLLTPNNYYVLKYKTDANFGGVAISVWSLDESGPTYKDAGSDDAFLKATYAHQNETATVYCPGTDGKIQEAKIKFLDCDENGVLAVDSYPDVVSYPLPVINDKGYINAFYVGEKTIVALNNSEFYADAPGEETEGSNPEEETEGSNPEEPQTAPPLPERDESESGTETESVSESESGAESESESESKSESESETEPLPPEPGPIKMDKLFLIVLAVGVAVLAAVAILMLVLRKNKNGNKESAYIPPQEPDFGSFTEPLPSDMDYEKTRAMEEPGYIRPEVVKKQEISKKLWLSAQGGYMNGRVYPVEKFEITIGRAPSSTICYPADTAGVSRVHAKLYWQNGRLMLMDCNSTNGTFLKRQGKLAPMVPTEVRSGDIFYIGEKMNAFVINE